MIRSVRTVSVLNSRPFVSRMNLIQAERVDSGHSEGWEWSMGHLAFEHVRPLRACMRQTHLVLSASGGWGIFPSFDQRRKSPPPRLSWGFLASGADED